MTLSTSRSKPNSGVWTPTTVSPASRVLRGPRADVRQRPQPVDAGVGPEVDEDDASAESLRRQRLGVEPAGRAVERRPGGPRPAGRGAARPPGDGRGSGPGRAACAAWRAAVVRKSLAGVRGPRLWLGHWLGDLAALPRYSVEIDCLRGRSALARVRKRVEARAPQLGRPHGEKFDGRRHEGCRRTHAPTNCGSRTSEGSRFSRAAPSAPTRPRRGSPVRAPRH